jgi:hypothetical protein
MKKTLLITLLLIPFLGISQTTKPIDGVLGIKFGDTREQAIATIKARGGIPNAPGANPNFQTFSNIKLGHRDAFGAYITMLDDKVYWIGIMFNIELEAQVIDYYNNLVKDISDVYGQPTRIVKAFKDPYKDGDGFETQAISTGNANYITFWTSGDNSIEVFITTKLKVVVNYYDNKTKAIADKRQKDKEKADF